MTLFNRKPTKKLKIGFLLAIIMLFQQTAFAEFKISGGTALVSKYVWRGTTLADKPTIQPTIDFDCGSGWGLNVWSSFALTDRNVTSSADELDFTINYATTLGKHNLNLGLIYYTFPDMDGDNTSPEIYASISPPQMLLSPEVIVYYDFNLGDDLYASLNISHTLPVNGRSLDLHATLGYNNGQFGTNAGFSHIDLGASSEFTVESYHISPSLVYAIVTESTVGSNAFYLGLSISK